MRQAPSRQPPLPHRSRGGGGGSRGGARASPATQPPPLLPPSATGPDATVGGPAPTPLLPPSATASVKMEPENKYLPELMAEKDSLDPSFTHAMQLLTAGKPGPSGSPGHPGGMGGTGFVPPASRPLGAKAVVNSPCLILLVGILGFRTYPGLRGEGEFLGCGGGPKGTWRSLSARILMDSAAFPAPLRPFPLPLLAAALLSECSDSSRNEPLPPPTPKGKAFFIAGGGRCLSRGCRKRSRAERGGTVGGGGGPEVKWGEAGVPCPARRGHWGRVGLSGNRSLSCSRQKQPVGIGA